jgi:hypothetical protein
VEKKPQPQLRIGPKSVAQPAKSVPVRNASENVRSIEEFRQW